MEVILRTYDLQLKHTFTISRESYNIQPTLIVELKDGGVSGFGEATSNPYYGVKIEHLKAAIKKVEPTIIKHSKAKPDELWQVLYPYLKDNVCSLCCRYGYA